VRDCRVKRNSRNPMLKLDKAFWPDGDYRVDLTFYEGKSATVKIFYFFRDKSGDLNIF
jgi:hypothetical protein